MAAKRDELAHPQSCMSKAGHDEMVFVLLGRDPAAPAAIRAWVEARVRFRKNKPGDELLRDAIECAETMEREGAMHKPTPEGRADA